MALWCPDDGGELLWRRFALVAAMLAMISHLPVAYGDVSCLQRTQFIRWLTEFERVCRPPGEHDANGTTTPSTASEGNCYWVTCPCIEVSLQVPVALDKVQSCYEAGALSSHFTEAQRRLAGELLRGTACGDRSKLLGAACGECDRYALERPQCYDTTLPPQRIFLSSGTTVPERRVLSTLAPLAVLEMLRVFL
mmetsp:Transcript_81565/g.264250  ORF Transcript_81565/g.264250 Transcript_81565/m.264250 type:complete len:194 (-) Transcript_81565:59-640(-)